MDYRIELLLDLRPPLDGHVLREASRMSADLTAERTFFLTKDVDLRPVFNTISDIA